MSKPQPSKSPQPIPRPNREPLLSKVFDPKVVKRALLMAIVVGLVLIGINHGMCLSTGKFGITCLWQSLLTFLVPYAVSTISSVLAMKDKTA